MSSRLAAIVTKVACFSVICALAVLGAGCEPVSGVWPEEATHVQARDGAGFAVSVGEPGFVFAGDTIWQLNADGFSPQSLLSGDYQVALGHPGSIGSPYLYGSVSLPEGTAFVRRGQDRNSDGQGVTVLEDYDELMLVSAEDPAKRTPLLRVRGRIAAVRLGQSADGITQVGLVEVSPRDQPGRHLHVMTRSRGSDWAGVWSLADEGEGAILVNAYGMVTSEDSDPAVIVVGDRDRDQLPHFQDPVVMMIDSKGVEREIPAQFDSDLGSIEHLSDFRWRESSTPVFRYQTMQGTWGLMFYDQEADRMRIYETPGLPLALLGDPDGGMLAITGSGTGDDGAELVGLEGGGRTSVQADFNVTWAKPLTSSQPGVQSVALIGRGSTGWRISILDYSTSTGGHALVRAVDSWETPPGTSTGGFYPLMR